MRVGSQRTTYAPTFTFDGARFPRIFSMKLWRFCESSPS